MISEISGIDSSFEIPDHHHHHHFLQQIPNNSTSVLTRGYDYPEVYELLEEYGYTMHICKSGGEEYNNGNKKRREEEGYQNIEQEDG